MCHTHSAANDDEVIHKMNNPATNQRLNHPSLKILILAYHNHVCFCMLSDYREKVSLHILVYTFLL